eukprot:PhF_6_TR34167/c0_g1_i2/m.49981
MYLITTVDGILHAIHPRTGKKSWSLETGPPLVSLSRISTSVNCPEPYIPDLSPNRNLFIPTDKGQLVPVITLPELLQYPVRQISKSFTLMTTSSARIEQMDVLTGGRQNGEDMLVPHAENVPIRTPTSLRVVRTNAEISMLSAVQCEWKLTVGEIVLLQPEAVSPTTTASHVHDEDRSLSLLDSNPKIGRCVEEDVEDVSCLKVFASGRVHSSEWAEEVQLDSGVVSAYVFTLSRGIVPVPVLDDDAEHDLKGEKFPLVPAGHIHQQDELSPATLPATMIQSFGSLPYVVVREPRIWSDPFGARRNHLQLRDRSYEHDKQKVADLSENSWLSTNLSDGGLPAIQQNQEETHRAFLNMYECQFNHLDRLGRGGCAWVLLAEHRLTKVKYAVKVAKVKPRQRNT